jgi:thioesterase domain-containing protein
LVAIKASGNRIPLYLIHGDNLSILSFAGIGKFINPDQPVYALQPKGMDGKSEPLASIESLAAFYNQAIFEQNPSGPYAVIGYSFGGYVAFEMAKQMRAKGKSVLLLGLFDTNTSNAENHLNNKAKFFRFLGRIIPKIKWLFQSFLHHPIRSTNYQITALKNRLRSYFKLGTKAVVEELEGYQKLMDQVNAVHHKALSHYHLVPVDEKIVLFKAMERIYFVDDFEFLGWRTYAKKGVEVRQISGDHDTMLKEENAPVLAAAIDDALLKAISEWKSESVNA